MNNAFPDFPESDDLSELLSGKVEKRELPMDEASVRGRAAGGPDGYHYEPCSKCQGRGKVYSHYTGRLLGDCFACKGAGKKAFRQNAAKRAQARQARAMKVESGVEAFRQEHADVVDYLMARAERWDFAKSLVEQLARKGSLSDGQLNAARNAMARDAERAAQRAAEKSAAATNAPVVDVTKVVVALETAAENGKKKPMLRLPGGYVFSLPKPGSVNEGAVYVKRGGVYLGKIVEGRFHRIRRECSLEMEAEVVRLAANAAEEAVAYGKETMHCACCGLTLTDPVSIERGIGPICAGKYGF